MGKKRDAKKLAKREAEAVRAAARKARRKVRGKLDDFDADKIAEGAREALAVGAAKGREVGATLAKRIADLPVDEWRADLEEKLRELGDRIARAETTDQARQFAKEAAAALGASLATSKAGAYLGVGPRPKRRRLPGWLWLLAGAGVGYGLATVFAGRRDSDMTTEVVSSADRLVHQAEQRAEARADPTAKVRAALAGDERTRELRDLDVNVADGTAFVRGEVPSGFDPKVIEEIVGGVEGVADVDLTVVNS